MQPRFQNQENGELCLTDPRCRALPAGAVQNPEMLHSVAYLKAYNADPQSCESYWGHEGRPSIVRVRISPPTLRLGFLILAFSLIVMGWIRTVFYTVVNPYEELLKHGKGLTREDVNIIWKIFRLWQFLIYGTYGLVIICLVYALLSMLAVVVLWGKTVLNHTEGGGSFSDAPAEQNVDEGRIRIE